MAEVSPRLCIASEISERLLDTIPPTTCTTLIEKLSSVNPQQFPPPQVFSVRVVVMVMRVMMNGRDGGNVHDEVGDARGRKVPGHRSCPELLLYRFLLFYP